MTIGAGRAGICCKLSYQRAFAFVGAVVGTAVGTGSPTVPSAASEPHLHMVTYMNRMTPQFAFLQVSAEAHGLRPKILGYGEVAWWPDGLGAKLNALRKFVFGLADQDIVIFVDALDVMVFAGTDVLVDKFVALERQHNRSVFFNAEKSCFPSFDDICVANYPKGVYEQWRYLNSGMIVGRVSAMRHMLREPVDNIIRGGDQTFYHRYFLRHRDEIGIDYSCFFFCVTQAVGKESDIVIRDRQAVNLLTGQSIALLHFVGSGHWPIWKKTTSTTVLGEVFGDLYPEVHERLFGSVNFVFHSGSAYQEPTELRGRVRDAYSVFIRLGLCCMCRLFSSGSGECKFARTWLGSFCFLPLVLLLLLLLVGSLCIKAFFRFFWCKFCSRRAIVKVE
eukprot:TRINITY_DN2531_c0_g1_i2.p1 TRINITY_DN2531_c0_g1~~TRINITY_DN2531_c0_g1_i2.p1  ORF type:complete len:427 (-),score=26.17 TRINITY_DN2531_c0_g1_i2:30-1202(-)